MGSNSMHSQKIIAPKCGGNLEMVVRHAGAVILPTAPQRVERTPGEGGYKAESGIVDYTGYIDHTRLYLTGIFCLYSINTGGHPSNTKLAMNKLRGTPCVAIIEVRFQTVTTTSSRRRRWYV